MSNSRTARRKLPHLPPVEEEEDLVEIGTAAAMAALPALVAMADSPETAVAMAWKVAGLFLVARETWAEDLDDLLADEDA